MTCPANQDVPYPLLEARIRTLRTELARFSVETLETRLAPTETPKPYDLIYVEMDPSGGRPQRERQMLPWMTRVSPKTPKVKAKKATVPPPAKSSWARKKHRTASKIQVARFILPK